MGVPLPGDDHRLREQFRTLKEGPMQLLISAIPADRDAVIEALAQSGIGSELPPMPEPTIADTLTTCQRCARKCWIGPRQNQLSKQPGARIHCYICVIAALNEGADFDLLDLGGAERHGEVRRIANDD